MSNYETIHYLLHTLWTKAVGTEDYDKQEWRALEAAINKLAFPNDKETNAS